MVTTWVCNEVSLTLWCHALVHVEVKVGSYSACFGRMVLKVNMMSNVSYWCLLGRPFHNQSEAKK